MPSTLGLGTRIVCLVTTPNRREDSQMTYQGARARAADSDSTRVFEVSKIRVGVDGRVSDVLWGEVDAKSGNDVSAPVMAPVAEVIDAIHAGSHVAAVFTLPHAQLPERHFVVVEHDDGRESIALDDLPSRGRELADLPRLDHQGAA